MVVSYQARNWELSETFPSSAAARLRYLNSKVDNRRTGYRRSGHHGGHGFPAGRITL